MVFKSQLNALQFWSYFYNDQDAPNLLQVVVALDFAHNTTPKTDADGKPVPPSEPQLIASFGPLSVVSGKGIVLTPRYWTPEGEVSYTGRHYPDLSPTVGKNEKGEVTFVHSVALTRAGQISNLHAFSAGGLPALTALQTTTPMDTNSAPDYKALLLQKLGIDPAATDEQIIAACDAPPATPLAVVATPAVTPLDAAARLDALQADFDAMKKGNLVAEATRAGKVVALSAESIKLTPLAVLEDMISKTPVTVPLAATTPAAVTTLPALKALSAEEKILAAQFGYTDEQWRKYNPA